MASKSHKDVEFHVEFKAHRTFAEAAAAAVVAAMSNRHTTIDIVVYSRAGARWLGGSDAVKQYNEDPEASVFDRIEVRANDLGRVP